MAERRVLVTGAGGFIGRWSLQPLRARGYAVDAVISRGRLNDSGVRDKLGGIELHHINLFDSAAVDGLLRRTQPTHLLHFAWRATPGIYWTSPENQRWVVASLELLRFFCAAGGQRVVMAGTCAEYEWSRADLCHETTTPLASDGAAVPSPYATCKIALQKMLAAYGRQESVSTAWGRIFFQYGPGEDPRRLVASVIRDLLAGHEARCSHGRQIRNFLHVADVGAAFAALLDTPVEGPVNIGSEARHSIAEMIGMIAEGIGRSDLVRLGARPAGDEPAVLLPDVHRLYDEVGWRPGFSLSEGLADTIAAWRRPSQCPNLVRDGP